MSADSPQPADDNRPQDSFDHEFEDAHKTFLDESPEREREIERAHYEAAWEDRHDYQNPDSGFAYDYAQHTVPTSTVLSPGGVLPTKGKSLRSKKLADIKPELVPWLWAQRISFGSLTILDGDPGCGKTSIVIDLMARLSRGDVMPFEAEPKQAMNSLIVSAEDSLAHTLRPRAEAARADLDRVFAMTEFVSFPSMVEALKETIMETRARMVLIDPILGMIDQKVNANADPEARLVLSNLAAVAAHTECAIVLVRHLNKSLHSKALYRGGSSIAFTAAARNALLATQHRKKDEGFYLASVKASLSKSAPTLTYVLEDFHGVVTVRWKDMVAVSAEEALEQGLPGIPGQQQGEQRRERKRSKLEQQALSVITIAGDKGINKTELRKVLKGDRENVDAALDELVERGWVLFEEEAQGEKGGRPSKTYRLNPQREEPQEDFE